MQASLMALLFFVNMGMTGATLTSSRSSIPQTLEGVHWATSDGMKRVALLLKEQDVMDAVVVRESAMDEKMTEKVEGWNRISTMQGDTVLTHDTLRNQDLVSAERPQLDTTID
jgi:hypothetical protein